MDSSRKPVKNNPRKGALGLSQLVFGWLLPLFCYGTRHGLNKDDLTKCLKEDRSEDLGDELEEQWEKEVSQARIANSEPKLRNALFRTFYKQSLFNGLLIFLFMLNKTFLPVVLEQLLVQFQESTNSSQLGHSEKFEADDLTGIGNSTPVDDLTTFLQHPWNDAAWLSGLLVLLTLIACFCYHHSDLRERLVGARMRIACCSLIYRKTLRMSRKAAGQTSAGYIINLLSNDVSRLDYGFVFVHYVWVLPLQACFTCYLIWRRVQWAAIVGVVGLLLKTIPVQTGLSRLSSIIRMRVAKKTDQRVSIMNELIQGIQVIKMYAWEKPFHKVVSLARKKEVRQIRWASYIRGIYLSLMAFTERSTLFLANACCVIEGRAITADIVFPMAQFFHILQLTAAIFYPLAVSFGAEALVSIDRIQEFLVLQEQGATILSAGSGGLQRSPNDLTEDRGKPAIELQNVTASWEETTEKTLKDISVKIGTGKLLAVIGPVGAGKSSLLQMLLGELPIQNGTATINGDVSYGSQEPWLFTGTVRNNILFGLPYDRHRYQAVVRHCALTTDFQQLPDDDKTVVGERGTSLSGGQRARVSLARAVYNNASIYLLDDPLSAVDAHVGKHLFDEVIGPRGYLAQKQKATRVLVTHQVHFLKEADWIVIIEGGKIVTQGTYTELANGKVDFGKLLQSGTTDKGASEDNVLSADIPEDEIPFIDGVTLDGYKLLKGSTVSLRGVTPSSCASSVAENLGRQVAEDQAEGSISWRIWATYFLSGGNIVMLLFTFLTLLLSQAIVSGSDYFVTYWTRQEELRLVNERAVTTSTVDFLYTYGVIIIGVVVFTIFRGYLFFNICMKASRNLHDRMFARILTAPMRFFDTNPSGRILNRFSKDMGAIDELLPKAMIEAIQILLVMTGILTMITIVNPLLLLPLLGAVLLYAIALKLYLRPIQDMKRLEGIKDRQVAEDQAEGSISWRIWATYFLSGGNIVMLLFTFLTLLLSQAIVSGSDYFVTYWTRQEELRLVNERAVTTSTVDFLYTYGVIIIGVVVFTIFRGYLFFNICMKASHNLHDRMFARILTAPMRFFDTNPSGRILNRFSKDMGAIDELLPKAMIEAIQILLVMTGILTMITIVNPLLLLPLLGAVLLYAIALKLYLRPIQDMKRLEGITRSPVFSHLSATLSGLSTIRASGVQEKIREEFDDLQNVHSAVWQLTMASNAALGLWLDCISTAFVACVTFSFIVLHQDTYSANVGLAISQALILTGMVQYGIRQTTESIQQMTAVERVVQYTEIASEADPPKVPPGDWPWKGQIQFHNMSLCYEQDAPPVLKNLELVIEPTWKVGIVGRTGAGKSSLIGALFRLARIEGRIMIDGIDTGVISLEALRSKISIIPQDPVLFSATIRYNLDPFSLYDDDMLWRAISEVELRSAISGLDFMVTEGGTNFSVGQRQLICLARAILRNNKILVLDEATANVDPQTDALIQKTIREKFKHCTVLTVAHRLHTVMDSDRILVMDAGEAREFDVPHILLQQEGGILKDMVEATGPSESESLKRIAAETYAQMDPNRHLMNGMPNPWRFGKETPQ
uniref:Uncharacterized protein n=1 Tax=Anopheles epiroticus TaxID=199890 RepID=A0A182PE47_9DIPT